MNKIGAYIFIIFIAGTVCYSLLKKRNVFQDFTDGVPSGLKTGLAIFPAITAMMLAVISEIGMLYHTPSTPQKSGRISRQGIRIST